MGIRFCSQHSSKIALLFFLIFYAELAGSLYAAGVRTERWQTTKLLLGSYNPYLHYQPLRTKNTSALPTRKNPVGSRGLNETSAGRVEPIVGEELMATIPIVDSAEMMEDIGGPGQPEMSSFRSASADNMVNLFTGDFSYNIPLLDLGGYPVNIFYSAGSSMDEEASWVGLGWNLNPGNINRNMRGLPDDFNGKSDQITNTQSVKADKTIGINGDKKTEIFGLPNENSSAGIFYNNKRGLGLEVGIKGEYSPQKMISGLVKDEKTLTDTLKTLKKLIPGVSGGIDLSSQNGMSARVGLSLDLASATRKYLYGISTSVGFNTRAGLTDISLDGEKQIYEKMEFKDKENKSMGFKMVNTYFQPIHIGTMSFARSSYTPTIRMPLTHESVLLTVRLGSAKKGKFKSFSLGGFLQKSYISELDKIQKRPAYGYMHQQEAEEDQDAIMDFNRLNDGTYTLNTPVISVPAYTYDVFSINGEGTGGSFRGYHGNLGHVKDNRTSSRSAGFRFYLDLGGGNIFHGGTTLGGSFALSESGNWRNGNMLRQSTKLKVSEGLHQGFYFKNPAEKAIIDEDFFNAVGGDQLIRPYLINTKTATPSLASGYRSLTADRKLDQLLPVSADLVRETRDKRTQAISFLTAEEADLIGLDRLIYSYKEGEFLPGSCSDPDYKTPFRRYSDEEEHYRKRHHISQVNVTEADGRRYVFGLPVYQTKQKEVTFSVNAGTSTDRLIGYSSGGENPDNSIRNNKGRDNFYRSEELPGYAHSFLLSGILSPDYVDVTGDGITEDDLGTAVKFNYSRMNRVNLPSSQHPDGANYWYPHRWRMPAAANKAVYNEGLRADAEDDKGMYTYGEKELWYLHSIESKNMVACFYTSNRDDGRQVLGENGGLSASANRLRKLDSIRVFTKAEFLEHGAQARPVKAVHFRYSYKLCENYPLNAGGAGKSGKLTLDSLWFTYNNLNKVRKNKYAFRYGARTGLPTVNPSYNSAHSDRWGNYKNVTGNPNDDLNDIFPYAEQDAELANEYAAAWNLSDILLPSGGTISVEYEADDYAFVQDRRASVMTRIAGFGINASAEPVNSIYTYVPSDQPSLSDHNFVFFDAATPIASKEQVASLYLQDFKQLLLKLWIRMPSGNLGVQPAYEQVMVYAGIKDYGLVPDAGEPDGFNHNRFYVELEPAGNGGSQIVQTVFQFLREQLPQRAYPGYSVKGDGAALEVIRSVWGLVNALFEGLTGFERGMKASNQCRSVDLDRSGARLNQPDYRKRGGGHRVKRIVIGDNWSKLLKRTAESAKLDSWYGQEYDYSTVEEVNGEMKVISSGVATYEPGIGNEENPFRELLQYYTTQPLGPTNLGNVELPFGETFFPSTMVGYSRVTVRSIHNKTNKRIKSGVGLQQTNYYTSRDFPVMMDYTSFDQESRSHHKPGVINKLFQFRLREYVTLTQGFRIVLNDMNGKVKSQASFPENDYKNPINFTAYHYRMQPRGDGKYRLDNRLPVIKGPDGVITYQTIGKDVELMNDYRQHTALTKSAQVPLNGDLFTIGNLPVLIPTFFRLAFHNENRYRSATTLKIINEYGILDSVVNIDKGSVVGTRNLVYDAETGDVLLTRTTNEFKDPIYQFNYPGWWVHSGMEPAYRNLDMIYSGVIFRNGMIDNPVEGMMDNFESGDEVFVMFSDDEGPQETVACMRAGFLATLEPGTEPLIWALDIRKDERNEEKKFIFLDRYGVPYNAKNATIRVVRSGKRNLSGASAGSFVSLDNPIREVSGVPRIVIDNSTAVVNAGAVEYREKWRANDQFYAVDTVLTTVRQTPIMSGSIYPDEVYSVARKLKYKDRAVMESAVIEEGQYEIVKKRRETVREERRNFDQNSWMLLDLPPALEGATIRNAKLILPGHNQKHPDIPPYNEVTKLGQHITRLPHRTHVLSDHSMPMTMKISRMISSWGDPSDVNYWLSIFDDTQAGDLLNNYTTYTPQYVPNRQEFTGRYEVDIRNLLQGMVDNYGSLTQASGIKLSFLKNSFAIDNEKSDVPWRFCFQSQYYTEFAKYAEPVHVIYEYTKCQESDPVVYSGPLGGAPTTPPAGYAYCAEQTVSKICLSTFDKKQMNPYIQGILGNWRGYRSYVFYGERNESDATATTNIRKDGQLKDFVHYWSFAEEKLGTSGDARWVWNSEITQYNRKGAELENRDPLDRYNAGIYGYQESLPVAVVNNSRLRLSAFDGFEDYAYQDDPCQPYCTPSKRHFHTGISTSMLSTEEAHTGVRSLKVNSSETMQIDIPVTLNDTETFPDQRIKIDRTEVTDLLEVKPQGIGLKGEYFDYSAFNNLVATRTDPFVKLRVRKGVLTGDVLYLPDEITEQVNLSVRWTGSLQVSQKGDYDFDAIVDDDIWVYLLIDHDLDGDQEWTLVLRKNVNDNSVFFRDQVYLLPGTLYQVKIEYVQKSSDGYVQLLWRQPGTNEEIAENTPFTSIPTINFYPAGQESLADGSAETVTAYCEKPDTIQAIQHHLIDSFALTPGQKMLASIWVKKAGEDCNCTDFEGLTLEIRDEEDNVVASFVPKENIIEGWQQMEAVFTVPEMAEKLSLHFGAAASGHLYLDDLRLHPFNANMKSFVYDPVTLRLVAELDENNFASLFEYDDEGTLIRVKKETRAGIKTITETRSAIQKQVTQF